MRIVCIIREVETHSNREDEMRIQRPMTIKQTIAYVKGGFAAGAGLTPEEWSEKFTASGGRECLVQPAPMRVTAEGDNTAIQFVEFTLDGLEARG